jgi:hypothetical protein
MDLPFLLLVGTCGGEGYIYIYIFAHIFTIRDYKTISKIFSINLGYLDLCLATFTTLTTKVVRVR